jgi:hypothetical protein
MAQKIFDILTAVFAVQFPFCVATEEITKPV